MSVVDDVFLRTLEERDHLRIRVAALEEQVRGFIDVSKRMKSTLDHLLTELHHSADCPGCAAARALIAEREKNGAPARE